MYGQPHRPLRGTLDGMRNAGWQEQVVPRLERYGLPGDLKHGFPLEKQNPFVLKLHVLLGRDGCGADDALNDQVPVAEDRVEAFALFRRLGIREKIAGFHVSACEW